jgi:hypothetical protein
MLRAIRGWLAHRRYGEPIVVVSGLPRSGTSMMMRMLEAGGLETWTDRERKPDLDNPKGYYELERVKDLDEPGDKSWLRDGRGRAVKVISHLLLELPDENRYRVLFMRRHLDEVLASQRAMLERRGEANPVSDAQARESYLRHLAEVKVALRRRPNFALLEIRYHEALADPRGTARAIAHFLDGRVDPDRMAAEIDAALYRNRVDAEPSAAPDP